MIITFIGGGNMATALIGGLEQEGGNELRVVDPNPEARQRLEREHTVRSFEDAAAALPGSDVVVLAVKPQVLIAILESIRAAVPREACVVSVAAGTTVAAMQSVLGADQPIVRTMPNTPALLGVGATGLFASDACSPADRSAAEAVMRAAGATVWVDEEDLINAVTAVSGSGPAYYYLMTEALAAAGERLGLPAETAQTLAAHTANGAGAMTLFGGADPEELRRRVTSPGGTTQAAIAALQDGGFEALVDAAAQAARDRGRELAQGDEA